MDPTSIAAAMIAARMGQVQLAAAAKMMRMNAQAEASIVKLIDAAQNNAQRLANAAAGIGANLDISA